MEIEPGDRILEFSRDPLFAAVYPDKADWVVTGRPLEPTGRVRGHRDANQVAWPRALVQAALGRYDLIVFPAIRLRTPGDRKNRAKRWLRRTVMTISRSALAKKVITRMLHLGTTAHIIRDVGDFPEIEEVSSGLFSGASLYLKREVLVEDLGRRLNGGPTVVYAPMPFDFECYEGEPLPKTTDVFFAARDAGEYRRQAREVLERLKADGVAVDMPSERISFDDYVTRIRRSRLVVSPRGQGEHCYRHYEALLLGSVPVINVPEKPIHYELEDGVTALFYRPDSDHLADVIRAALADPDGLARIADSGAALVRSKHAKVAICSDVLGRISDRRSS